MRTKYGYGTPRRHHEEPHQIRPNARSTMGRQINGQLAVVPEATAVSALNGTNLAAPPTIELIAL